MAKTILLADDSITIQKIVNLTFSGEGIDVVTVSNGDAALKKAQEIHPDLILADIFMPGENGYELCEHVKSDPTLCHTPVILLVGAYEPFDQNEAAHVKADGHLTKPFEIRVLISAVTSLIAKTEQEAAQQAEQAEEAADAAPAEIPIEFPDAEMPAEPVTSEMVEEVRTEAQLEPLVEAAPSFSAAALQEEPVVAQPTLNELFAASFAPPVEAGVPVETVPATESLSPAPAVEEGDLLGIAALEIPAAVVAGESEMPSESKQMVIDIWETPAAPSLALPKVEVPTAPSPMEAIEV